MSAPGPIRVAVIDVSEPLTDLDCRRDGDSPYVAAWILVCRAGRPLAGQAAGGTGGVTAGRPAPVAGLRFR